MKTKRYTLTVETSDTTMVQTLEISRQEFERQMHSLKALSLPFGKVEKQSDKTYKCDGFTETQYVFTRDATHIILSYQQASKGHTFKSREELRLLETE